MVGSGKYNKGRIINYSFAISPGPLAFPAVMVAMQFFFLKAAGKSITHLTGTSIDIFPTIFTILYRVSSNQIFLINGIL